MKRVKKIVFVILSILLGLILAFNIYNFISIKVLHKEIASVNGYAVLEVVSGSMEPTIHVGDIIIINTKDKDYNKNDIITFRGKQGEFVTHRIKSIDGKSMITQGDNNDSEDDPIATSSIVGKYVTKISGGGKILSSFKNPFTMGMIFIIGLLACILLSTDSDGKPLLDEEEKEFQEFLKTKNENKEQESKEIKKVKEDSKKGNKKTSDTKKKTNTTSKKDTKEINTNKSTKDSKTISNTKKVDSKDNNKKKETTKKVETKKVASKKENTANSKVASKKEVTSNKKTTKKNTTTKSSKK